MLKFLGKKKFWWLTISALIMVPGIIALIVWKLPLGIDFKGGALLELQFDKPVQQVDLADKVGGYPEAKGAVISKTQAGTYLVKILPITEDEHQKVLTELNTDFGKTTEVSYQLVGPSVSRDLTFKAVQAIIIAAVLIILYLAYAFRAVSHPVSSWRFGTVAVAALLHDLVITVGTFTILAHFLHYEIDSSFITAMLTVMGFSVHDTIVVFDRIRENLIHNRSQNATEFEELADKSLGETLNRSLSTSLTVLLTLLALTVLGGESIRSFVVTLLIGIAIGTYSSIFTATPLLVIWQNRAFTKAQNKNS